MKFSLTNIGKIAQADIEINGLTVLGGYNDIGKSTIGKTLFSVIKTISDIEQEVMETIIEQVEQEFSSFSIEIRKMTGGRFEWSFINPHLKIKGTFEKYINSVLFGVKKELESLQLSSTERTKANELWFFLEERIKKICNPDQNESYKKIFDSINYSLFRDDLQNKKSAVLESIISLADDSCNIVIHLENERTKLFSINGSFPFQDVTLIESPLILGWASVVSISRNQIRSMFGHYIFDLLNKIRLTAPYLPAFFSPQTEFVDKIGEIIGGKMCYDRERRDLTFTQGDMIVKPVNLASGIKMFGIVQILLTNGVVALNTVLIIDEPEAHLHPEWQLKYAEVLTQLVDMGVYVLVSTHSPYMIKALKHYSDKLQQEKITNFYLGNAGEHGTIFTEVTQDLNPLFKLLAMPMQRLAFED